VGLGVDFADVERYVHDNDAGTAALLHALWRRSFTGRLVVASSMVVYGEGRYTCEEHGVVRAPPRSTTDLEAGRFEPRCPHCGSDLAPQPVPEHAPLDPRNVYAATKLHTEHLAVAFAREASASVCALRYHNVYGPGMPNDTPYAGVASIFRSALEAGRAPEMFEDGRQLRDFVHVDDVARANVLALTSGWQGAVNIASGRPRTVGEMADLLVVAFGADAPPPTVTGRFRLGDVRHVTGATDLAREAFGFEARVPFEEGIRAFAHDPLRLTAQGAPRRQQLR
jgi:dTDP-L-rhamnose 4-epimerase